MNLLKKTCVIGLGYIGLQTASLASQHDIQVYSVDVVNSKVVEAFNKGETHITKQKNKGGRLTFSFYANVIGTKSKISSAVAYSNLDRTASIKNDIVNIKVFGAQGDGVTDDAHAFRKSIAYLVIRGGGTILIPPGIYFLDSFDTSPISQDEYAAFVLSSNITIKGESNKLTSLKISATLQSKLDAEVGSRGGRINFIGVKSSSANVIVRDINFNYNGIVLTDNSFRSYNAIHSAGSSILIERIRVLNAPGRNMIVSSSGATVRESIFTNENQNVIGNSAATDASFIYLNGRDNLIENNIFSNTDTAISNSGGVEVHASNSKVLNNKFINLYPAIYDGIQDGTVAKFNQIKDNYFENCRGGILSVDKHSDWLITGNYFLDSNIAPWWSIMTPRDDITGITSADIQENVTIENNIFETRNGDPQRPYIRVAGFQNSVIKGNKFNSNLCPVCFIASTTDTKNVLVTDNLFKNPPSSTYVYGQVHLSGDNNGKWAGSFKDILVQNNQFLNDATLSVPNNIYPFASSGAGSIIFTNNMALNNKIVNMNSNISGSPMHTAINDKK